MADFKGNFVAEISELACEQAIKGVLSRGYLGYFLKVLTRSSRLDLIKIDKNMPGSEITPEYLADNIWIVGSLGDVVCKIYDLDHEVGGFGLLLAMGHECLSAGHWEDSMTALIDEVIPKLNSSSD